MAMHTDRYVSRLTKGTLALILAGGKGSRLHDLTRWRAKPAVPFGGKFRIIDFTLSNCMNSGIRRIGVLTQYKAHSLIRHIQKGWGFLRGEFDEFVELLPAQQRVENCWYRGTADAVYQNLDIILSHEPAYILVLAADHIYKMDYGPLIASHVENEADLTIGCIEVPVSSAHAFGVMSVGPDDRVLEFNEKPCAPCAMPGKPDTALVSMGIYIFNADFLIRELMRDASLDEDSTHDFGHDIIPHAIQRNRVFAHPFRQGGNARNAYWRDVGTVDAYWQANLELTGVTPELNLYDKDWPIWTYQEQAPPCKFVFDDDNRRGVAIDSMVSSGSIISGANVKRSVLFNDVMVESGSIIRDSVILHGARIGRHCRIRKAILDNSVILPDNTIIGEDPAQDSRYFHVSPGGVVLVTPEMLGQKIHFEG
jgi:glucose-1-phosphate adenylyltransferase